jgi:hypothetical protein
MRLFLQNSNHMWITINAGVKLASTISCTIIRRRMRGNWRIRCAQCSMGFNQITLPTFSYLDDNHSSSLTKTTQTNRVETTIYCHCFQCQEALKFNHSQHVFSTLHYLTHPSVFPSLPHSARAHRYARASQGRRTQCAQHEFDGHLTRYDAPARTARYVSECEGQMNRNQIPLPFFRDSQDFFRVE